MGRPTVDDVFVTLAERIGGDAFPPGSRLPSCRALADGLGSNPSTVNRALHRLSQLGLVRTEPRRGTFVTARAVPTRISDDEMIEAMAGLVRWGRAGGIAVDRIHRLFSEVVDRGSGSPEVGFVECNEVDAIALGTAVTNATGVIVHPVVLDELENGWRNRFDVLATPLFHLADVKARVGDLDRVVELVFLPAASPLRLLADLESTAVVTVASPTRRGLEVIAALVSQYFPGEVRHALVGGDGALPDEDIEILVFNNAARLGPEALVRVRQPIRLDWELDAGSAATFPARVESVAAET